MIQCEKSKYGLKFTFGLWDSPQAEAFREMLKASGLAYSESQGTSTSLVFKTDAVDNDKVEALINSWATAISDIQFSLSTKQTK